MNPHDVTRQFESELARYTGAKFAVTTTSCTQAILMALMWWRWVVCEREVCGVTSEAMRDGIEIPCLTYAGVPASILNADFAVRFRREAWAGEYQLKPLPVWDSARRFTSGMFRPGQFQAVSFHWSKICGLSQGGAVLHDDAEADAWMRRYRFDGRSEGVDPKHDQLTYPSAHAYLSPEVAAHGLMKLSILPKHNADLPNSDYPDLSLQEAFKNG